MFPRKPSAKKQSSSSRLSGSSFLRRLSFSQHRRDEDEMALISSSQEPLGQPDVMTETEMSNYHSQIRRLSDINAASGNVSSSSG